MASRNKFIVSACLAGTNCTYKAGNNLRPEIKELVDHGLAVAACPEVLGGLRIPRKPSEIIGGDGKDVLCGKCRVVTSAGKDVTASFLNGSRKALGMAKRMGIKYAILKSNSPACGAGWIYDGSFSSRRKRGDGVFTSLLKMNGVAVYTED